ncbi:hypothetical protein FIV42_11405 [Persicimonas caeni]|jgi:hypothetical protein|uniref:Flagellar protein FliT n=1 Tax=Persicimonas caeni TaxID=2292766 RepID=A0A4Y6PSL4_PERCE|nr:hypothetical protein [Persicimonas caeni]QDG51324.1 hypothetical protein FIV42_11405 [Persicimonas caeni]QED32545.1 hypothetical protein FRD00_11400 [Persicimonas caeni]
MTTPPSDIRPLIEKAIRLHELGIRMLKAGAYDQLEEFQEIRADLLGEFQRAAKQTPPEQWPAELAQNLGEVEATFTAQLRVHVDKMRGSVVRQRAERVHLDKYRHE